MAVSAKSRILTTLSKSVGVTLSVKQARARFGISNVSARVSQLRDEGHAIVTSKRGKGYVYSLPLGAN
jgi:biotin operon repressor